MMHQRRMLRETPHSTNMNFTKSEPKTEKIETIDLEQEEYSQVRTISTGNQMSDQNFRMPENGNGGYGNFQVLQNHDNEPNKEARMSKLYEELKLDDFQLEILHEVNLCTECNMAIEATSNSLIQPTLCNKCQQKSERLSNDNQSKENSQSFINLEIQQQQRITRRLRMSTRPFQAPIYESDKMDIEKHVDILDSAQHKKDIHIGHSYQAVIPEFLLNNRANIVRKHHSDLRWEPNVSMQDFDSFQDELNDKYSLTLTAEQIALILKKYNYNLPEARKFSTRDKIREIAEVKKTRAKTNKRFAVNRIQGLH